MNFSDIKKLCGRALGAAAAVILLAVATQHAQAVTDAEMNEAQAIAAKFYVRYVNNGAGYLDNWLPKSMDDLEKKLTNNTDRENFRKFKSMPHATDYAGWDKEKLTEYWSEAFFAENGKNLDSKAAANGLCKKQIKAAVSRMAVAAPAAVTESEPVAETAAPEAENPEAALAENVEAELQTVADEIDRAQELSAREEAEAEEPGKPEKSGTWVYVMILAILVAVVIFLVVYASKTMKGGDASTSDKKSKDEPHPSDKSPEETVAVIESAPSRKAIESAAPAESVRKEERRSNMVEETRMREKYAATLASKTEEIRSLNRQLSDMENLAAGLKEENRRLNAEIESLRQRLAEASAAAAVAPAAAYTPRRSEEGVREVYLGRVNSKGIFIRADRHAVDGQSIYKLSTANGHTGTFSVISNPLIEEQVMEDPARWLAGGCTARDLYDTDGREGIVTEAPGTAVFRDGAWRVDTKARIRYV